MIFGNMHNCAAQASNGQLGCLRDVWFSVPFPNCRCGHTGSASCCSQGNGRLMPQEMRQSYTNKPKHGQHHLNQNWKVLFSCGSLHYLPEFFSPPRIHVICHLTSWFLPLKGKSIFPQPLTLDWHMWIALATRMKGKWQCVNSKSKC